METDSGLSYRSVLTEMETQTQYVADFLHVLNSEC